MRNFIRNIIDRLRGLIHSDARDTIKPTVVSMHPIPDGPDLDIQLPRFGTAALTPVGILFKGIRYHSDELAAMLPRMSRNRVAVKIKDPSDASSIFVWDSTARPIPRWITVERADAPAPLSIAQHARPRRSAQPDEVAFSADRLMQHWEKPTDQAFLRDYRQALRCIDLWDVPVEDELSITADDVKAEPVHAGAGVLHPRGRKPSKSGAAKAKRTKTRKIAEAKAKAPTRVSRTKRK